MGTYAEIQKRIIEMKKEREKWKTSFESLSKRFSSALESNTVRITKLEGALERIEARLDAFDRAMLSHSNKIEALEEKLHHNDINTEIALKRIEDNNQKINDFIRLVENRLSNIENLSGQARRDLASMESERKANEEFRHEMRNYVEDLISTHEKAFDLLNKEKIKNLENSLDELKKLHEEMKEKLHKIVHKITFFDERLENNRDEIKKFREYVISHINDVLSAYDSRFNMLKRDISHALDRIAQKK